MSDYNRLSSQAMVRNPERLRLKVVNFLILLRQYREMAEQEGMRNALAKARAHLNPVYGILLDDIKALAAGGPTTFENVEGEFRHALSPFDMFPPPPRILQALDGAIRTLEVVQGRIEREIDEGRQIRIRRLTRGPLALVLGFAFGWLAGRYQANVWDFAVAASASWPIWKQGAFLVTGAVALVLSAIFVNLMTAHGLDGLRARPARSIVLFALAVVFGIAAAVVAAA